MNNNIRIARELVRIARILVAGNDDDTWENMTSERAAVIVMDWLMRHDSVSYHIIKVSMKEPGFTEETDKSGTTYSVNGRVLLHVYTRKIGSKTAIDFDCLDDETKTIMPE